MVDVEESSFVRGADWGVELRIVQLDHGAKGRKREREKEEEESLGHR